MPNDAENRLYLANLTAPLRRIEGQQSYSLGPIDPVSCAKPIVSRSAWTDVEAAAIERDIVSKIEACRNERSSGVRTTPTFAGPDPAVLEAERRRMAQMEEERQLALQREERQRQLDAQAAEMEAERQAMVRDWAQQSLTQTSDDLRTSNADFARQSQDIRDANAELEAWLNGN